MSISGMAFCGADVGGFFGNPDGSLFVRWYQAASFQPFFRSHAHIDTKRREPWLYSKEEMGLIRQALRWRYSFLPYWYTLFYEAEKTGVPPMRPVFYEFPEDEEACGLDNQYMLGDALLVHPIVKPGVNSEAVYFPGSNQVWYDIFTGQKIVHQGNMNVAVFPDRIPVYQRGGSIIPKKERIRRSSSLMAHDPFTLHVALDVNGKAHGTLYMDDGKTYNYRKKNEFVYIDLDFANNKMTGHVKNPPGFECKSWLERVVVHGYGGAAEPKAVKIVSPVGGEQVLKATVKNGDLIIRKPGVNICAEWEINIVP